MKQNTKSWDWFALGVLFLALLFVLSAPGCGGSDSDDDDDDGDDDDDDGYYDDDDDDGFDDDDDGYYDDDDDDDDDDTGEEDPEEPDYSCPESTEPTVLYLSADDSNSQASPVIARAIINQGDIVPGGKVRTYEFTNYYQIEYQPPASSGLRIVPQLRERTDGDLEEGREFTFQIGVQSHTIEREAGRPLNVVFSLDTSGSMAGSPMNLMKDVCRAIAGQLQVGDVVSMVEWDSSTNVILNSLEVSGPNDQTLLSKINNLQAGGSTNLHGGLVRAYDLAGQNFRSDRMNRVVLISDGQANTGITDIELIAQAADDSEGEGIYMVGVGVGEPGSYYNDYLMDDVTDAGKGAYVYIDTEAEANLQFGERFEENMEIAAMNVQVELTMPYYLIMSEFHGEEYSENPDEVDPQHLGPNDAMIFHQFLVACELELLDPADPVTVRASYIDPVTRTDQYDEATMTMTELFDTDADQLLKGDAIVTYAEALKQIDGLLYSDPSQALTVCQQAKAKVEQAAQELADSELLSIAELLDTYQQTLGYYQQ